MFARQWNSEITVEKSRRGIIMHGVQFCGICGEFPCRNLSEMVPWNPRIAEHLEELAMKYRGQGEGVGTKDAAEGRTEIVNPGETGGESEA